MAELVEQAKIVDYTRLTRRIPTMAARRLFFLSLGFTREDWQPLAASLRELAVTFLVTKTVASPHGQKYILDGTIQTPSGRSPSVRTIWIVDSGLAHARFVTHIRRKAKTSMIREHERVVLKVPSPQRDWRPAMSARWCMSIRTARRTKWSS